LKAPAVDGQQCGDVAAGLAGEEEAGRSALRTAPAPGRCGGELVALLFREEACRESVRRGPGDAVDRDPNGQVLDWRVPGQECGLGRGVALRPAPSCGP